MRKREREREREEREREREKERERERERGERRERERNRKKEREGEEREKEREKGRERERERAREHWNDFKPKKKQTHRPSLATTIQILTYLATAQWFKYLTSGTAWLDFNQHNNKFQLTGEKYSKQVMA